MKIAITGVTGFRNRGVEALVRPIVQQLFERYPEVKITITTWSPDYDAKRFSHPQLNYVEDAYLTCGLWVRPPVSPSPPPASLPMRAFSKILRKVGLKGRVVKQKAPPLEMPFEKPDLIIVSGGDLYSSDYGTDSLRHFLSPVKWAKENGVPCALVGQSVGKFKCPEDIDLWKQAEANASLITLREPLSLEYLTSELGSDSKRFIVTADSAFLLNPDTAITSQQPYLESGPAVALSISESICGWTGNDYERHVDAWVSLIRMMLDEWGVNVAIIPHVQEGFSDDRILSSRLFRLLGCDRRLRVFAEDLNAAEYKGIISQCEMVIAERMHAAIAGFSSGICTVPIGYSIKAKGITQAVLDPCCFKAEDLALPLDALLDLPQSKRFLTKIWQDRSSYRDAICTGKSHMEQAALENFDLIDSLVGKSKRYDRT